MRAILCRAQGVVALDEIAAPVPGPGQIVVASRAIAINYPDLLVIDGRYQSQPPFPFSPGKEVAGIVAAVGPGVDNLRVGDRVLAAVEYGAYADAVLAEAWHCQPIPSGIGDAEAVAMGLCYQTAYFALLDRGQYRAGEIVLVTGASGSVGLAAVQLAKALDGIVLAGVSRPARVSLAKAAGADHIIDLGVPDLRDALREQVRKATARLVDVALDPVGGDVFDAALRALAWRGRMVTIGFAGGRIPEVKANYLLVKNIAVAGLQWSDYRDREPQWVARAQAEIFAFHAAGKVKPPIAARFPLAQFAAALDLARSGDAAGRIVLHP